MGLKLSALSGESGFDSWGQLQHPFGIEQFISITQALGQACDPIIHGRGVGFLRRAAQSLADAGGGDAPESAGESIDDEIRALSDLLTRKRRWLSVDEVEQMLRDAPA